SRAQRTKEGGGAERGGAPQEEAPGRSVYRAGLRRNATQIAAAMKITNHTSAHSGIERPRKRHFTAAQSPDPAKIFGRACASGKFSSRNSRSLPHDCDIGGLCCSHDCRIAVPPPTRAKRTTALAYTLSAAPARGPCSAATRAARPM